MFEDSLVESRISHASTSGRLTALTAITLQCALAAALVALPLLHPERLVSRIAPLSLLVPIRPKPPVRVERPRISPVQSNSGTTSQTESPHPFPTPGGTPAIADAPSSSLMPVTMPGSFPLVLGSGTSEPGTRISVLPPAAARPLPISAGVSAGMLIVPIRPIYPAIAKAAGVQGTVVIEAVISRAGKIESLHVLSGPPMLQRAAIDSIKDARYRPYRLNGEPTQVETTITINFRLEP